MPRYVVTTRRRPASGHAPRPALDVVSGRPGVSVVSDSNPNVVTIDTDAHTANSLKTELADSHFVEPEIRRDLAGSG
jgi:hypothetical protein